MTEPRKATLSPAGLDRLQAYLSDIPHQDCAAIDLLSLLQSPGERRFGRFVLRRVLGQGKFGVVFLADDPQVPRVVAVKLPQPGVLLDPEQMLRFHREAE